jgi:hypothetical protein
MRRTTSISSTSTSTSRSKSTPKRHIWHVTRHESHSTSNSNSTSNSTNTTDCSSNSNSSRDAMLIPTLMYSDCAAAKNGLVVSGSTNAFMTVSTHAVIGCSEDHLRNTTITITSHHINQPYTHRAMELVVGLNAMPHMELGAQPNPTTTLRTRRSRFQIQILLPDERRSRNPPCQQGQHRLKAQGEPWTHGGRRERCWGLIDGTRAH